MAKNTRVFLGGQCTVPRHISGMRKATEKRNWEREILLLMVSLNELFINKNINAIFKITILFICYIFYRGRSMIFLRRGRTPKEWHIFKCFFLQNLPAAGHLGGGGARPLHPPPWSAPVLNLILSIWLVGKRREEWRAKKKLAIFSLAVRRATSQLTERQQADIIYLDDFTQQDHWCRTEWNFSIFILTQVDQYGVRAID